MDLKITGLRLDAHIKKPGSRGGHIIGYSKGEPIYGKAKPSKKQPSGQISGRKSAIEALTKAVKWNPKGRSILARGGNDPRVDKGPSFLTTDPDFAVDYSDDGKRQLATYSVDTSHILIQGSREWTNLIGEDENEKLEDLGPDLFTDPPKEFLRKLHSVGYVGYATHGGGFVRVEDPSKVGMRFHRSFNHHFKKQS